MRSFRSKNLKVLLIVLILSLFFTFINSPLVLANENTTRFLFIISIDHVNAQELLGNGTFKKIINKGSAGLLATRTGTSIKSISRGSAYASISSGEKLVVSDAFTNLVFNESEEVPEYEMQAGELYIQRTVYRPTGKILAISLPALIKEVEAQEATGLGKLTDILEKNGILTMVLGNSDDSITVDRSFAISLINSKGEVREGDITKYTTDLDTSFPGGYITDFDTIEDEIVEIITHNKDIRAVFWIESGDTTRLERYFKEIDRSKYNEFKGKSIQRTGEFILRLIDHIDLQKDTILILSAVPSISRNDEGTNLTVVAGLGKGFGNDSFLYSGTTRQQGLVTLIDIPPTILSLFGVDKSLFSGNPIISKGRFSEKQILALDEKIKNVSSTRATTLTVYVVLLIIGIIASSLVVIFRGSMSISGFFTPLFLTIAAFPLALLIVSPLYSYQNVVPPLAAALLSAVSAWGLNRLKKKPFEYLVAIGSITGLVVVADATLGAPLTRFSPLGYNPVIGARFYGIGNEYMGILVSGALLAVFSVVRWMETHNMNQVAVRIAVLTLFVIFGAILGYPGIGANVGGALSAAVAFLVAYVYWRKERISLLDFLKAVALLTVIVILLIIVSPLFPDYHLAKVISQAKGGYFEAIGGIVYRKIMISIKLLKYTIWSDVLLTVIIAFPVLMMRPPGLLAKVLKEIKPFNAAVIGAAFGAVAAFFLNDSGVVAAATMVIYPALGILSEIIRSEEAQANG